MRKEKIEQHDLEGGIPVASRQRARYLAAWRLLC